MPAEMLRICVVTTFFPPHHFGGDAVYAHRFVSGLVERGHEVTVVHSVDAHRMLGGEVSGGGAEGVTTVPLRRRLHRTAALASYLSGRPAFYRRDLERVLQSGAFDVIHFQNVSLVGGPGVLRLGDGIKLYTAHEHWLVCPMHVLFRDNRQPCTEPHCLRCTLRFRRPPQPWRYTSLLDRSAAEIDTFFSPSRFTIEAHRTRGFPYPMRHLPYFLPTSEVDDGEGRFDNSGRPYFLYVGRLERLKGVHVLIDAFRGFQDAELLVVGDGTQGEALRRQADGLGHVRFLGRVHWEELGPLYRGATALLVPSVGYETFGIVGVEAMARGTPVVVNDLGALPELVTESGGGLVYSTADELVGAMRRLLESDGARRAMGERGQATWRSRWSEEPHFRTYFDAVDEAMVTRAITA